MAARLRQMGVVPDLIFTSPAKRARKTAQHIARGVGYPVERIVKKSDIYSAGVNTLLGVIRSAPAEVELLFLVGHNYVLTDLAEFLTGEVLINVPTSGIVAMHFGCDSWEEISGGQAEMELFDYPKKHRQGGSV